MKYSIKNFRQDFPDDKTCLAFIFKHRYPKGLECPKCARTSFVSVEGRRSYACACGYQVYPTEGTIFHKSPTSLTLWFHAIFLMSQSKNGVAAKELERLLGVTYKCAWRMAKQIRLLMVHGTFHAVSPKHLQTYLDEFSFRYNHRGEALPVLMFAKVGTLLPKVGKTGS